MDEDDVIEWFTRTFTGAAFVPGYVLVLPLLVLAWTAYTVTFNAWRLLRWLTER